MKTIINLEEPIIEIRHSDLERHSEESAFKSKCPKCKNGVLLIYREENGRLREFDACIACGQRVKYLDIDKLRKLDGVGLEDEL